jgi:NitT/TauT family transport system substrate-binding protein
MPRLRFVLYRISDSATDARKPKASAVVAMRKIQALLFKPRISTLAILTIALLLHGENAVGQSLADLRASYDGTSGFNLPIWILESTEIDKRHGLDVKTFLVPGVQSAQAVVGGSFQYSQSGIMNIINAAAQGGELVALGTSEFGLSYKLVGRKGMTVKELKGAKIGVAAFGGTTLLSVKMALQKLGVSERDVRIIVAGNTSQRVLSLMAQGGIDATVLSPPSLYAAEKAGLPIFIDVRGFSDYPNSSLITTKRRVRENREEVRRVARAWTEAIAFFALKPKESQDVLRKYLKLEDADVLRATYDFYLQRLPKSPRISEKAFTTLVEAMADYNPKVRNVTFDQVTDMSFVEEMERDGFVRSLYP